MSTTKIRFLLAAKLIIGFGSLLVEAVSNDGDFQLRVCSAATYSSSNVVQRCQTEAST